MLRNDAIEIWEAGVAAVHGRTLVESALSLHGNVLEVDDQSFDLDNFDRILVVGGGKFSHFMAEGLENVLGSETCRAKRLTGLVTVPDGSNDQVSLRYVESAECRPAGINLPTQRVLDATDRMLQMLSHCDERTLVFALVSGGGSALLENSDLVLDDIIAATNWLSTHGANILQLNTVRIALSNVKGGGLRRAMPGGLMIGLIVSDVPGDDLRFVSSGPTVSFGDDLLEQARTVLDEFDVRSDPAFPSSVIDYLSHDIVRTGYADLQNLLIGNASVALMAASEKAIELGYSLQSDLLTHTVSCEDVANAAAGFCRDIPVSQECMISLGEPVVSPGEGAGQGGRNQHAVLLTMQDLFGAVDGHEFCFMSAGTDGEDGNTSSAGALFTDHDMVGLADPCSQQRIADCLTRFDSHTFLSEHGLVYESGFTGTNVADLRVLLRRPKIS